MSTQSLHAVIAGGTSGIGLATAQKLASQGMSVTVTGRDEQRVKDAINKIGYGATGQSLNANSAAELNAFASTIGTIDHLVIALSGRKGMGMFRDLPLEDLQEGFNAKFFAQIRTAKALLPRLAERATITFITASSTSAMLPGTSGLAAINGALEVMIPILAKELTPIRVNGVSPGVINTPWWDAFPPEVKQQTFKQLAGDTPAGRIGEPDDIVSVIELFINNTFLTGRILVADGGLSL